MSNTNKRAGLLGNHIALATALMLGIGLVPGISASYANAETIDQQSVLATVKETEGFVSDIYKQEAHTEITKATPSEYSIASYNLAEDGKEVSLTKEIMPVSLQQPGGTLNNSMSSQLVKSTEPFTPVAEVSVKERTIVKSEAPERILKAPGESAIKALETTSTQTIEPLVITSQPIPMSSLAADSPSVAISVQANSGASEASGIENALVIDVMDNSTKVVDGPSNTDIQTISVNAETEPVADEDEIYDPYELIANDDAITAGANQGRFLLQCVNPDPNYTGQPVSLSGANRDNFYRLVMGEAGNEGYEGAALVAQALRDTMVMTGNYDTLSIKKQFKYSGTLRKAPNADVINAVDFVLDGGSAVQHRVIYFYAPGIVSSRFHESQEFIIQHGGHRVFDKR